MFLAFHNRLVPTTLVVLFSLAVPVDAITLVDKGRARATIVTPDTPSEAEALAAERLQYYLGRISGATVKVVPEAESPVGNKVFVGRRDQPKSIGMDRSEFVAGLSATLGEVHQGLYDRALKLREENTRNIDSLDEFKKFFTPKNANRPEIHGGFALCHFVDCPEVEAICKDLKVTVRCIPLQGDGETGTCIFTGQASQGRAVFAKAY